MRQVYEALEQQVLVLRMLQAALGRDEQVSVLIGSENTVEGMEACSLVTSAYLAGDASGHRRSRPDPTWTACGPWPPCRRWPYMVTSSKETGNG